MSGKILWNSNWEFGKVLYGEDRLEEAPAEWQQVDIPHDWLIYDTQQLYANTIGWYRKQLEYHNNNLRWIVRFEGVYMDSTIYVNEAEIGTWKYGYSTFEFDITDYLAEGENEIKVRVVHIDPNSRWYSGAGIYRNVWLIQKEETHIVSDGVYITPVKQGDAWRVEIDTEVHIGTVPFHHIRQTILDDKGNLIASVDDSVSYETFAVGDVQVFHQYLKVYEPRLWDIGKGNLYWLRTEIANEKEIIDLEEERFGFRTIHMDANEGFFINGRHVKIQGSCEHHGFGCLGAVTNKAVIRRKLEILRQMGVNAIRTAHNMPSTEFMELADEMGFLVDSEAFDMWERGKTPFDYGRFFAEWVKKDVASWIRRDRNHPSIIMWSVGNEIYDLHAGEKGMEELRMLIEEVKEHDYKHHGKITFASNYLRWENTQKCAELVDLVGYNYTEDLYEKHHKEHPEWIIYGSETASMLASRNVYHFPLEKDILCEDNQQCSALGNCFAGWGAHDYLDNIIADRDAKFSLGQFIWSGFDYFGEPTPYKTRNSYFGQSDTAGFAKDAFYIYQAEWTNYKESPMIHIFPYWDFNIGQPIDVCVCSNAPSVELYLNGKSLGRRDIDHRNGKDLVPHWTIPYEVGELYAVAYDEQGNVIAQDRKRSFGNAAKLCVTPDKYQLSGDGQDLVFVEISVLDENDNPVENANNRIYLEVTGAGRLIGIDNGDSTDFDQVKGKSKRLFQGKLLAVIAARGGCSGQIQVKVSSVGMEDAVLNLYVSQECQISTLEENQACPEVAGGIDGAEIHEARQEIPIRKIVLTCDEGLCMNPDKPTLTIKRTIEPDNATYDDLIWKIVDDTGIEVGIAGIEGDGDEIRVHAHGDGRFQVRCIAMNGGTVANVRSSLPITIEGMGTAYLNPYTRISAGMCKEHPEGLSEGVEHGVRFLGKQETCISYRNIDFGRYGTETLTMEMFKYMEGPIRFQIYAHDVDVRNPVAEDEALTGGVLLLDGSYAEVTGWMVFKKQTYHLNERLCGIKNISIVSTGNFQLKSLQFDPIRHGLEQIQATEFEEIFGDSYELAENEIRGIGNNVTIHYSDLDFGEAVVSKLVICGSSELENNSIHVKIEQDGISRTELIEFAGSAETIEREFAIEPISGEADVRFVFLPGSHFDFTWFRFR